MASVSTLAFGAVIQGHASGEMSLTVTNSGTQRSGAVSTAIGGSDMNEFSISTDTCSGHALAANETCAVSVRFAPPATCPVADTGS